jgi:hypothetical protein
MPPVEHAKTIKIPSVLVVIVRSLVVCCAIDNPEFCKSQMGDLDLERAILAVFEKGLPQEPKQPPPVKPKG